MSDITLTFDDLGIWLIEETANGPLQMGHITWKTVAVYIREYL